MPSDDYAREAKFKEDVRAFRTSAWNHKRKLSGGIGVSLFTAILSVKALSVSWPTASFAALCFVVALASFFAFQDQTRELEKLRGSLAGSERIRSIQTRIAELLNVGHSLRTRAYKENGAEFIHECKTWEAKVGEFLECEINALACSKFTHPKASRLGVSHPEPARRLAQKTDALEEIAEGAATLLLPPPKATSPS